MYLEHVRRKHGNKNYVTTLIRESYRDGKKVKHRTLANISRLPQNVIQAIEAQFNDPTTRPQNLSDLKIINSREYGASKAFVDLAKQLELDKIIYSRKETWRQDVLAMIIGRLLYQGSKLHLCHLHNDSFVWEAAGYEHSEIPDVNKHCYCALDQLLVRQSAIQKELAKRHLSEGCLVLYDITSSYLEGEYENSELVAFGYSRDNKRKHEQIVIGLLTNAQGCPVAVEVFRGNTSDQTTVLDQAQKLATIYQVENIVFVGDRGMLTQERINEVKALGYKTLTALSHTKIRELCKENIINPQQFKIDEIVEVVDPHDKEIRYCLCKNPEKAQENKATRQALIVLVQEELGKIAQSSKKNEHQKSARIGTLVHKYKVGKYFSWGFKNGGLHFQINEEKIAMEEQLDGCYVIRTDSELSKEQAVANYKSLANVERAFRNIKTMSLEIRPVYHHLDERIKAHVLLCMLAYYLEWHANQRLAQLFAEDGTGSQKRFSFARIIERLKSIRIQDCYLGQTKLAGVITTPDDEQTKILNLIKGKK